MPLFYFIFNSRVLINSEIVKRDMFTDNDLRQYFLCLTIQSYIFSLSLISSHDKSVDNSQ